MTAVEATTPGQRSRAALDLSELPCRPSRGSKDDILAAAAAAAAAALQPSGFSSSKIKFEGGRERGSTESEVQLPHLEFGRRDSTQDGSHPAYDSALASSREERESQWPMPVDTWRPSFAPMQSAFQSSLVGSFQASSQGSFQGSQYGSSKFEGSSQHGSSKQFDVPRLLSNVTLRSDDETAAQLSTPTSSWKSNVDASSGPAMNLTSPKIKFESRRSAQSQDTPLAQPSSNNSSRKDYSDSYLPSFDGQIKRGGLSDDEGAMRLPIGAGRESIDQPAAKFKYEVRKHSSRQSMCDVFAPSHASRRENTNTIQVSAAGRATKVLAASRFLTPECLAKDTVHPICVAIWAACLLCLTFAWCTCPPHADSCTPCVLRSILQTDDGRMSFEVQSWQHHHQPRNTSLSQPLPTCLIPNPAQGSACGLAMAHDTYMMRKANDANVDATIHVSAPIHGYPSRSASDAGVTLAVKAPLSGPMARAPVSRRPPQVPHPPSGDASGESDSGCSSSSRTRPYGRPRNSELQQAQQQMQQQAQLQAQQQAQLKPGESLVGRGKSFPVHFPAGVLSAEPSGEWWSPATLRDRLRTSQGPGKHTVVSERATDSPAADSPIEEARQAWRSSPSNTADLDKETSANSVGDRPARLSGGGNTGLSGLMAPLPPASSSNGSSGATRLSQHVRPRRAISDTSNGAGVSSGADSGAASGENSPILSDSKLSQGAGRRESLLSKLSSMRVRRNPRMTLGMGGLEDVQESGPTLPRESSVQSAGLSFYKGGQDGPAEPVSPDTPGITPRMRLPVLVSDGGRRA